MCNLYSITTNQAAIIALFRVINRYVGNLPPMPGVFPDYPAPVIRNTDAGTEMATLPSAKTNLRERAPLSRITAPRLDSTLAELVASWLVSRCGQVRNH